MSHHGHHSSKKNLALLVLRVFVGGTFVFHGILKAQHMTEPLGTVDFFKQIGFSPFWAYLVTVVEIGAGAAFILGIFSLYSAILLAIIMIVSSFKVKWGIPNVPFLGRYLASELDLSLLASLLSLGMLGSGEWSLARFCKHKCHSMGSKCGMCKVLGCDNGFTSSDSGMSV